MDRRGLRPRRVRRGPHRLRRAAVDLPQVLVLGGLQHRRAQPADRRRLSRQGLRQRPLGPPWGEEGWRQFEEDHKKYNFKGVKVYTAEWIGDSRGYKIDQPEAREFLKRTQDLGIRNIHLHKGPTIWPLDKDAFNIEDVDHAATDFPELNFIVEHVGLPRIEDFCYTAVQEPNVYELLFWVGEDRIVFGSDYGIWEPKWQVEGFIDWQMPDDEAFSDYPRLTTTAKKKIMGLNSAKLYDIEVPAEYQLPAPGTTADEQKQPGEELLIDAGLAAGSQT